MSLFCGLSSLTFRVGLSLNSDDFSPSQFLQISEDLLYWCSNYNSLCNIHNEPENSVLMSSAWRFVILRIVFN
jgi:hypothetical protein